MMMSSQCSSDGITQGIVQRVMPASPKLASASPNSLDEITPWGFGFEFEQCLQAKWEYDQRRQDARLRRYGRFGMDAEDARQRTPEDMREAYHRFLQAELDDVHTPTPSPSPEPMPRVPAESFGEHRRPGNNKASLRRSSVPKNRNKEHRHSSRTEKKDNTIAPAGVNKRRKRISTRSVQKQPSTHAMETRSQKRSKIHK